MLPDPEDWRIRYSRQYRRQVQSKFFRRRAKEIERRLDILFRDPYGAAGGHRLKGQFAGLRSADLDGKWRFMYRICRDCRVNGDERRRPIDCCLKGGTGDQTVNILMISEHYAADIPEDFDFDD